LLRAPEHHHLPVLRRPSLAAVHGASTVPRASLAA
jgi:hypothetical protein